MPNFYQEYMEALNAPVEASNVVRSTACIHGGKCRRGYGAMGLSGEPGCPQHVQDSCDWERMNRK